MKKQNAITLIALVISIIILLILAGVSISMLFRNRLFDKAKFAKQKTENAQIEENIMLEEYANLIDYYNGNAGIAKVLSADEVSFTPTDINWNVDNVKDALDYLYSN